MLLMNQTRYLIASQRFGTFLWFFRFLVNLLVKSGIYG